VEVDSVDSSELKTVDGSATEADGTKAAWFTDGEGNVLGLVQFG
jgi:hypothetical protein